MGVKLKATNALNSTSSPIRVSDKTRKALNENKIYLNSGNSHRKYNYQIFNIQDNYTFLGNLYVVRTFIQKKYNFSLHHLEFLLYLYSLKLFSWHDIRKFPANYELNRLYKVHRLGYIELVEHKYLGRKAPIKVYRLTRKYVYIIHLFYQYLSGHKPLPRKKSNNPLLSGKIISSHGQKMRDAAKKLLNADPKFRVEHDERLGDIPIENFDPGALTDKKSWSWSFDYDAEEAHESEFEVATEDYYLTDIDRIYQKLLDEGELRKAEKDLKKKDK